MRNLVVLGVLAILPLWASSASAQISDYYYSGPISGFFETYPDVVDGYGGFTAIVQSLTANFYYNPVAQTLQEVGTVTVAPGSGTFTIYQTDGPGAPSSPPQTLGTESLTIGNNGSFPIDMTFVKVTSGGPVVGFPPFVDGTAPPVEVPTSGTVTYEGVTTTVNGNIVISVNPAGTFDVEPTTLSFQCDVSGFENDGLDASDAFTEGALDQDLSATLVTPDTASTLILLGISGGLLALLGRTLA